VRLPKENELIKVGSLIFKCEYYEPGDSGDEAQWGRCALNPPRILLQKCKEGGERFKEETFIHELLHAMFQASGLSPMILEAGGPGEEDIIRILSPVLYQVLKDNYTLFQADDDGMYDY